jgi:hypothetical protein
MKKFLVFLFVGLIFSAIRLSVPPGEKQDLKPGIVLVQGYIDAPVFNVVSAPVPATIIPDMVNITPGVLNMTNLKSMPFTGEMEVINAFSMSVIYTLHDRIWQPANAYSNRSMRAQYNRKFSG